jgi:hypothetical protein
LFPETLERLSRPTGINWYAHSSAWLNNGVGEKLVNSGDQDPNLLGQFIWADQQVYQTALEMFPANIE